MPRHSQEGQARSAKEAYDLIIVFVIGCLRPWPISHIFPLPAAAHPLIVVRQRKPFRRKDGLIIYFEDNAGVIVNPKGDLKGMLDLRWCLRSTVPVSCSQDV